MFDKLEAVEKRYEELNQLISDPEVISRQNEWKINERTQRYDRYCWEI